MASDTKFRVLERLVDGNYHSGEGIGNDLGISRAAVSSHIKSLSELGLDIYSITGKGYKLSSQLNLLNKELITELNSSNIDLEILSFEVNLSGTGAGHKLDQILNFF